MTHMCDTIIKELMSNAAARLMAAGIDSAQLDAAIILSHILSITRENLFLQMDKTVNNELVNKFNALVERRCRYEPVAYITGSKEFWSLDFTVTTDTLIPRPDSETLVEAALERAKKIAHYHSKPLTLAGIKILDIGTGTGCLLIALLKELPQASGIGVDISKSALQVAEKNAKIHGVNERARFKRSNWHDEIDEKFDLIVSNPPYITSNDLPHLMKDVTDYEPHLALVSGIDGMDSYRAISSNIRNKLNVGGYILMEIGLGQEKPVAEFLTENGLVVEEVKSDLAGVPRCVVARKDN